MGFGETLGDGVGDVLAVGRAVVGAGAGFDDCAQPLSTIRAASEANACLVNFPPFTMSVMWLNRDEPILYGPVAGI